MLPRALIIPGIQDVPEDWTELKEDLSDVLHIDHATRIPSVRKESAEEWNQRIFEHESALIRNGAYSVLMAHSFGNHRLIRYLNELNIECGISLNPVSNTLNQNLRPPVWQREKGGTLSAMESTLWDITLDMSDDQFRAFVMRQEKDYEDRGRDIAAQFSFLKKGLPFNALLEKADLQKRMLVLQCENDPWYSGKLSAAAQRDVVELGSEHGHYPHVSAPSVISHHVREWLHAQGFISSERQEAAYT